MTDNVALDVVIGLVFVYLLYSLYATVLMEIISSVMGLRANNLRYALKRMLMDEKAPVNIFVHKFLQFLNSIISVAGVAANLTNNQLYKEFRGQPSIRYLGSGGLLNSPSYISPEAFSKGVMDAIKTGDNEVSALARIEEGLHLLPEDSSTRQHLQSLLDDANNDLIKFKILLERWYNDTMDRATGWYKRSTQVILVLIALILAVTFNVDTLAIIKKLSTDTNARNQMVAMATDFTNSNAALLNSLKASTDSSSKVSAQLLAQRIDSLQKVKTMLEDDITNSRSLLASAWHVPDTIRYQSRAYSSIHRDSIQIKHVTTKDTVYFLVHKSVDEAILKGILPESLEKRSIRISPLRYRISYVFSTTYFAGYLLTILALSLGAPFWFDLLNKLVKLRSSKAITTSEAPASAATSAVNDTLNRAG